MAMDPTMGVFNPNMLLTSMQSTIVPPIIPPNIPTDPTTMFSSIMGQGTEFNNIATNFMPGLSMPNLDSLMNSFLIDASTADNNTSSANLDGVTEDLPVEDEVEEFPLPEEGKPTGKEPIDDKYKNADGTTKSAKQILDESPITKNLGDQKDIKELKNSAKKQFGDWETEKDPEVAARSAIKFRQLLEYSDNSKSKSGNDRGKEQGNGSLSGITKDGDIRDGTEASTAINYFRHGRQFVVDSTEGGRLKTTKDKYVREDGTTRSDAGQFFVDVGKGVSHVFPGLGNVISGTADGLDRGLQEGDLGAAIGLGLKGGANGALYTFNQTSALLGGDLLDGTMNGNPSLDGTLEAGANLYNGKFTETL